MSNKITPLSPMKFNSRYVSTRCLRTSDVSERRSLFPRPHLVARPRPFQCTHPPHPASIPHSGSSQLTTQADCRAHVPARCSHPPSQLTPYPAGQAPSQVGERSALSPIHSMLSSPLSFLEQTERRPKNCIAMRELAQLQCVAKERVSSLEPQACADDPSSPDRNECEDNTLTAPFFGQEHSCLFSCRITCYSACRE